MESQILINLNVYINIIYWLISLLLLHLELLSLQHTHTHLLIKRLYFFHCKTNTNNTQKKQKKAKPLIKRQTTLLLKNSNELAQMVEKK